VSAAPRILPALALLLTACSGDGPTPTATPGMQGIGTIQYCRAMGNFGEFRYDDGLGAFLIPGNPPLLGCLQERGWKQGGPNMPAYAYVPPTS
jgi:hypothetical protein